MASRKIFINFIVSQKSYAGHPGFHRSEHWTPLWSGQEGYNEFFTNQACSVSSFFCIFTDLDFLLVRKNAEKNLANIQPSWVQAWSITVLMHTQALNHCICVSEEALKKGNFDELPKLYTHPLSSWKGNNSNDLTSTMELRLMATSVIWSPRYYGQLFWLPGKYDHTFSCKETLINTVSSLLWPFFDPLVTVLMRFYYN